MKEDKKQVCDKGCRRDVDADARKYSGVAIDMADGEKVDKTLVKERTADLNNNPRNDDAE